jgi:putative transposase
VAPERAVTLVDRDTYLLQLARYVMLNPVRAGVVQEVSAWPWSSYSAMVSLASDPAWPETDWVLGQFGRNRRQAQARYAAFVAEGIGQPSVWEVMRY